MHCKIPILMVFLSVASLNAVSCEMDDSREQSTRRARFISFETTNDNIRVDLDFTIPFISIPIKKTLDTVGTSDIFSNFPSVNINVAGMALGGAVVLASTFILPLFLKTLTADDVDRPYARYTESALKESPTILDTTVLENSEFQSDVLLRGMNELLIGDPRAMSCLQLLACSAARNSAATMSRNSKSSHFITNIASNTILGSFINGTAVESAFRSGFGGEDCSEQYVDCPVSQENVRQFLINLTKLGKY